MCDLPEVLTVLEEKRHLLRKIEDATQRMLTCDSVRLEELMAERERLVEGLQRADERLEELCRDREDGQSVLDAAAGRGKLEEMTGPLAEVYQAAQQLRAILSRLRESETQAVLRLKQEQLEILEKIKAANQGGAAKAARFYSVGSGQAGGSRLGRA